jgi:hypothetical protein
MVAVVVEATLGVVTVAVSLVFPAAIVTLASVAAGELLLKVTSAPPGGAEPVRVTVAVEVAPPITDVGLTETPLSVAGTMVRVAVDELPA